MDSTKGRSVIPLSFVSTSSGHDECRNGTSNGGFQEDPLGSPSFQETPETDRQSPEEDRVNGLPPPSYNGQYTENIAKKIEQGDPAIEQEDRPLVYRIGDATPIHLTLFFAMQQALLSLSTSLAVSLLVAEYACAEHDEDFKSRLLASTLFMNGITTLLMVTIGVRLPLYQGATPDYVAPLVAMAAIDKDRCQMNTTYFNASSNTTETIPANQDDVILYHIQTLQGSLMLAGAIHFMVGATGLVGILLRFIGPVTIVPTILLIGIYMVTSVTKFAQVHWGISSMTCAIAIILSLYLAKFNMPIPVWTRKKSCHVIRYPFHQVFAILIAIVIGWVVSIILTEAGVFDSATSVKDKLYYARTDSRSYVIDNAKWFQFPYPGQFGLVRFSVSAFVGFFIATIVSILDSIGDYYACATTCRVPPPPPHAVNRGIAIEGLCTILSGALGCGHGTTTYGGNIGAIGLTKVASRHVFVCVSLVYILFGVIAKFSAIFITIPHPVLGGALIIMFGMFNGVVLSNLQSVDLTSTRNSAIIGTSLLVGLMMPHWIERYPDTIDTGNPEIDDVLKMLLGNPNMVGAIMSCFLDNTVPGSPEERGITAWQTVDEDSVKSGSYQEGFEVYKPWLPGRLSNARFMTYIPFMPNPKKVIPERHLSVDLGRRKNDI
ncbi:solute carrier family 23 member 1-like [Crassostrea virginica]